MSRRSVALLTLSLALSTLPAGAQQRRGALADDIECRAHLGHHAAMDNAAADELFGLRRGQCRAQAAAGILRSPGP